MTKPTNPFWRPPKVLTDVDRGIIRALCRQAALRRLGPDDHRLDDLTHQLVLKALSFGQHQP